MRETITTLITADEIEKRIQKMADKIMEDFAGRTLTLICVLKGGVFFMVDLSKKLNMDVEFDFMEISSYGNKTYSSGAIKIEKDLKNPITGKNVLLVEDIIDSGRTLSHLIKHLNAQEPETLKICTLLDKPERREVFDVEPEYTGFVIPDKFVVGFGLDYAQRYRNLPFIGVLNFEK